MTKGYICLIYLKLTDRRISVFYLLLSMVGENGVTHFGTFSSDVEMSVQ